MLSFLNLCPAWLQPEDLHTEVGLENAWRANDRKGRILEEKYIVMLQGYIAIHHWDRESPAWRAIYDVHLKPALDVLFVVADRELELLLMCAGDDMCLADVPSSCLAHARLPSHHLSIIAHSCSVADCQQRSSCRQSPGI